MAMCSEQTQAHCIFCVFDIKTIFFPKNHESLVAPVVGAETGINAPEAFIFENDFDLVTYFSNVRNAKKCDANIGGSLIIFSFTVHDKPEFFTLAGEIGNATKLGLSKIRQ